MLESVLKTSLSSRSAKFLAEAEKRARGPLAGNSEAKSLGLVEGAGVPKASRREASMNYSFNVLYKDEPLRRRQALSFAFALKNEPLHVFDGELVSGLYYMRFDHDRGEGLGTPEVSGKEGSVFAASLERYRKELPEVFEIAPVEPSLGGAAATAPYSSPGHISWHWDWVVREGYEGALARIAKAKAGADAKGLEVLEGMELCVIAALDWAEAHLQIFKARLKKAASASEKAWLEERVEICSRVPRKGARNFREAVQAFHFAYLAGFYECPYGGNSPGRLDLHLWPFLKRDLENERIDLAQARELVDELFIRFHERWMWGCDGAVETIVLAGSNPDGSSAANPLTKIMIESFASLKGLTHPSVYVRMPERSPEWLKDLAVEYLLVGGNRAQAVNDKAVVEALSADGEMPVEHARDYMCGGCMELSSFAKAGDMLFTKFFNVAKIFEYVISGGVCLKLGVRQLPHIAKDLRGFSSFEELYSAFEMELARDLELAFKGMEIVAQEYAKWRPAYYVSSLVEDCIGRGRTINDGGALYEDIGFTPLGLPNVADSLTALKIAVFERGIVSASELLDALKTDFAGREPLRLALRALPKYGQGDKDADAMMKRVVETVCGLCSRRRNFLGGKFKPMIMTFMMAPIEGAKLGASADGRRAWTPIAQGITPQSSSMTKGIGTAMLSASSIPVSRFNGGASHIWDLDPCFATPATVKSLVEVFFKEGGQMFQGNTTDVKELKAAQADPESHRNLTVRVGGYSATFVTLSPSNQEEVVGRARHKG